MKNKTDYRINTNDQTPLPSNVRLENCVLGVILELPSILHEVYRHLSLPGLFYYPHNEEIWKEIARRYNEKLSISSEVIAAEYRAKRQTDMSLYVLRLPCYGENPAYILQQVLKLNEYAIQRNILRLSYDLNIMSQQPDCDALEALGKASEGLNAIYQHLAKFKTKGIAEGVDQMMDEVNAISQNPNSLLGLSSSLFDINMMLRGYRKGNMIVLAASTGEGKTTLAIQECLYQIKRETACGYFSLEMPSDEILLKLACTETNIPIETVLSGTMTAVQNQHFKKESDWLKKSRLLLNDAPGLKMGEIKAQARLWVKNSDCKLIVIDHLHLVNSDSSNISSEQKFTEIANQIKELSKELNIPIIALAQLARKERGEKRFHQSSDLKYASGIEQAADVVLFIYRPAMHGVESPDGQDISRLAHIYTGKSRLLKGGKFNADFDGLRFRPQSTSRFTIPNTILIKQKDLGDNFEDGVIPINEF